MLMTVQQLIEQLQKFDSNLPVYYDYDFGYKQYDINSIYETTDCYGKEARVILEVESPNWPVMPNPANLIAQNDGHRLWKLKED